MLFKYVSVSWAVKALASPRFTIFNFIFLLLNTLLIKPLEVESLGFISLAVSLMFVNLLFRFIKKKGFSTFPLGLFHLALLIFIGALGAGSLFYFYGYMELAEGQKDGVQRMVQGVFHKNRLEGVLFRQGPLSIRYNGKELVEMKSSLVLESPEGLKVSADVQFLQPFKWSGYDVYIHRERGYAVELEYTDQLKRKRGFVDFPDYIRNPSKQTKYFDIPGEDLGFVGSLNIPEGLVKKGKWALEIPENASLTLERGGEEFTLNPGASAQLKQGGSITFLGISRWANYVIYKNSFGIVLAGSGLLAVVALFCHMLYQTQKKKGATGFQLWN